ALLLLRSEGLRQRFIVSAVLCCAATLHVTSAIADSRRAPARSDAFRQSSPSPVTALHNAATGPSPFVQGEWPFRPLVRPAVPSNGAHDLQTENPIDVFVNQKLNAARLKMNPPADKLTLLRRVTFDLTGLPPTREEQESFIADTSATAYMKVVD